MELYRKVREEAGNPDWFHGPKTIRNISILAGKEKQEKFKFEISSQAPRSWSEQANQISEKLGQIFKDVKVEIEINSSYAVGN